MVSLDLTLQFPTLHAYAVLLQEELGLAVEAGPDVPPLAGNAEPNQDPQLAADWLTWWRAILRKNTPIGQLADPDLSALSDQPHPLVNFPRLYAALHDDARLYDDAHQAAQAWHNRRPWPPAVPPRDSFLDALVCSGLHRWHVRRRLARKLQVSFKEPCTLVVLPVPGI